MELVNCPQDQQQRQQQQQQQQRQPQSNMFDELRQEIDKMDPYAETITLTYHLRQFADLFQRRITDAQSLNALFAHLNEAALADNKFAVKVATVFASHQLGDVMVHETKIRNAMIGTLQQNFLAVERLKQASVQRFYNSITLLGEYYNRKKVALGRRINILGQSLLLLLTSELEQEITKSTQQPAHQMDGEFAKLLLEQVTLNGAVAKEEHRQEITDLLFTIRKALITVPNLSARAKAFLLMAVDLYHANLAEDLLEKLYNKYLIAPQEHLVRTGSNEPVEVEREQPNERKQLSNGDEANRGKEKSSPESAPTLKVAGIRTNTNLRVAGGKTPSPKNNATTHDKENKRRPSPRAGVVASKKTSPSIQACKRNVRLSEDGNIVATITRDAQTTPTKKTPPTPVVARKGFSARMEKLAAPPKITITCSTPSPKKTGNPPAATSPRAVLGVSSAKQQQPQHPPKSSIRKAAPKSGPEGQKTPNSSVHNSKSSSSQPTEPVGTNKSRMAARAGPPSPTDTDTGSNGLENHGNGTPVSQIESPIIAVGTERPTNGPSTGGEGTNGKCSPRAVKQAEETADAMSNGIEPTERAEHHRNGTPVSQIESPTIVVATERPTNGPSSGGEGTNGKCSPRAVKQAEETADAMSNGTEPSEASGICNEELKSYFREENMENLSWNDMIALDDDSPQKLNPHTKSFLSFLADE